MTAMNLAKSATSSTVIFLAAMCSQGAAADTWRNVVQNGSFEQGMSHWNSRPPEIQGFGVFQYKEGIDAWGEPNNLYRVFADNADGPLGNPGLDPVGDAAMSVKSGFGVSQMLTLAPGHYRAGLDVFVDDVWTSGVWVWLGSRGLFSGITGVPDFTNCFPSSSLCQSWAHHAVEFDVEVGGVVNLLIVGKPYGDAEAIAVDRVYVAVREVPEPGTIAMMLAGLGAIGVAARRRAGPRQ